MMVTVHMNTFGGGKVHQAARRGCNIGRFIPNYLPFQKLHSKWSSQFIQYRFFSLKHYSFPQNSSNVDTETKEVKQKKTRLNKFPFYELNYTKNRSVCVLITQHNNDWESLKNESKTNNNKQTNKTKPPIVLRICFCPSFCNLL